MLYTILGVEHVYDAFDVYEHPNTVPPFQIDADSPEEALSKGRRVLQSIITDARRKGGFLSSGEFIGEVVRVVDENALAVYKGRDSLTVNVGFGDETFSLAAQTDTAPYDEFRPESELVREFRVTLPAAAGKPGVLLVPTDIRLVRRICDDPAAVYSLTPRDFEELVAELLTEFGFGVRLTPLGADGGIDIFAEKEGNFGPELYLVQCKRHRRDRKVGLPIVKQLNADLGDHRASRGLLVTTSYFTKPALKYIEQAKYQLSGADFDRLLQWLKRVRGG